MRSVDFAGEIALGARAQFDQRLARVVAAKVDGLGDIGIGFAPRLGLLVDFHRGEAKAVAFQPRAEFVDAGGAGFQRQIAPGGPRFFRDGDGLLDVAHRGGVRAGCDARLVVWRDVKKRRAVGSRVAVDDDGHLPRHLLFGLGDGPGERGASFGRR